MNPNDSEDEIIPKEDMNLLPIQFHCNCSNNKSYQKILFKLKTMGLSSETRKNFRFVHSFATNGAPASHELIVRDNYKFSLTTQIVCKCQNYTPHHQWFGVCGTCSNNITGNMTNTGLKTIFTNTGRDAKINVDIGVSEHDLSSRIIFSKRYGASIAEIPGSHDAYHLVPDEFEEDIMRRNKYFKSVWTFDDYDVISEDDPTISRTFFSTKGSIVILCDVTILNPDYSDYDSEIDVSMERDDIIKSPEQSTLLSQQFSDANINPSNPNIELGDVILVVDKTKIYCHKMILSMSGSFFKKLFATYLIEKNNMEYQLNDHSLETIISLLKYLYGQDIPSRELTPELLAASDFYGVLRLKEMCIYKLAYNINWKNVSTIWKTAYLHNLEDLSHMAIAFMAKHWNRLSEEENIQLLVEEYPNLILVISKLLSENQFRTRKVTDKEGKITKIE